jgi:ApbE superfamily uncharacterized protein (UPF0280 family)
MLPDGRRLHLHHGPIDLIIEAFGSGRLQCLRLAEIRFQTVLDELVVELELLRQSGESDRIFQCAIARRMQNSVEYFLPVFITPMAAVAGAVADEILDAMIVCEDIDKIYVNNGGDTAIYLSPGHSMKAAIAAPFKAEITIEATDPSRGIATSGWRGRSQSLGIADSVSVVASNCACADAAATMIANAVNLPVNKNISRTRAREIFPDSDLGDQLVTIGVGDLTSTEISTALDNGELLAQSCLHDGAISGAMLILKNQTRQIGALDLIHTNAGEMAIA